MIRAPKCAIRAHWPDPEVTKHLLSVCRKISERQKLTDLCLKELDCKDLTAAEAPVISKKTRTMFLANHLRRPVPFPVPFMTNILHHLRDCVKLQNLQLKKNMDLHEVEKDLDQLLVTLVSRFEHYPKDDRRERKLLLGNKTLSDEFIKKWGKTLEDIKNVHCEILK